MLFKNDLTMRLNKTVHRKPCFFLNLKTILKQDFFYLQRVTVNTLACNHPSELNVQRTYTHIYMHTKMRK